MTLEGPAYRQYVVVLICGAGARPVGISPSWRAHKNDELLPGWLRSFPGPKIISLDVPYAFGLN